MPDAAFFGRCGLYVAERFLEPDLCQELCAEISAGIHEPGTVGSKGGDSVVDREQVTGQRVDLGGRQGPRHPMTGREAALRGPGHLALPQPVGQVERVDLVVRRGFVRGMGHSGEAWSSAH